MFAWLSSQLFFAVQKPMPVYSDSKAPKDPEDLVWVHLWDTSSKGVGHAAIQVGGDIPKRYEADSGRYMSLWPSFFPTSGIFSFIPGPAATAVTMDQDMQLEKTNADAPPLIIDFSSPPLLPQLSKPTTQSTYIPPTRSIKITGLDTKAILAEMDQQEAFIREGKTTYQLFPQLKPFDMLLIDGPALISHDTMECFNQLSTNRLPPRYNCTMFVVHLLKAGGMPNITPNPWQPWGLTPSQLADKIDEQQGVNKPQFNPF